MSGRIRGRGRGHKLAGMFFFFDDDFEKREWNDLVADFHFRLRKDYRVSLTSIKIASLDLKSENLEGNHLASPSEILLPLGVVGVLSDLASERGGEAVAIVESRRVEGEEYSREKGLKLSDSSSDSRICVRCCFVPVEGVGEEWNEIQAKSADENIPGCACDFFSSVSRCHDWGAAYWEESVSEPEARRILSDFTTQSSHRAGKDENCNKSVRNS